MSFSVDDGVSVREHRGLNIGFLLLQYFGVAETVLGLVTERDQLTTNLSIS